MKSWLSCPRFCCVQDVDILERCNVDVVHRCTTLKTESSCNKGVMHCFRSPRMHTGPLEPWSTLECKVAS